MWRMKKDALHPDMLLSVLVFLDLSAAFEMIDHQFLLRTSSFTHSRVGQYFVFLLFYPYPLFCSCLSFLKSLYFSWSTSPFCSRLHRLVEAEGRFFSLPPSLRAAVKNYNLTWLEFTTLSVTLTVRVQGRGHRRPQVSLFGCDRV